MGALFYPQKCDEVTHVRSFPAFAQSHLSSPEIVMMTFSRTAHRLSIARALSFLLYASKMARGPALGLRWHSSHETTFINPTMAGVQPSWAETRLHKSMSVTEEMVFTVARFLWRVPPGEILDSECCWCWSAVKLLRPRESVIICNTSRWGTGEI